jgi:uroporphyrinogen decarboxylase
MTPRERMVAACRFEEVDRPPVWLMRQAGRYLPEYHEARGGRDFWTLVRTPEIAAGITMQPVRRFGMDAAIVFSDILTVPAAMGVEVVYGEGGPELGGLVRGPDDVARLRRVDAGRDLGYVAEAVRLVASMVGERALVGFAGAPFTLACYMVGGRGKEIGRIRELAGRDPGTLEALVGKLAEVVGDLAAMQVEAGAHVVQIFDTWAGMLEPDEYERWALGPVARVVERLEGSGVPVILYVNGAAPHLEAMARSGCDVLSVDSGVGLGKARALLGRSVALQGNLDPARLLGPVGEIGDAVRALVAETGGRGHVVNLGHGVLPATPVEAVKAFVDAVRGEP